MGLNISTLKTGLDALAAKEPKIALALKEAGYPPPRISERGYQTLLRTIVGQQVSLKSAAAVMRKLEALLGADCSAEKVLESSFDELRACGLSRQKQGYARSLAEELLSGSLRLEDMPAGDEDAITMLTRVKGIGRWSAEIYLLFAEGREDIWPAGDLAIQESVGRIMGLDARPSEKETRALAERWSPHRGAAAIFTWHHYNSFVAI